MPVRAVLMDAEDGDVPAVLIDDGRALLAVVDVPADGGLILSAIHFK